MRKQINEDSIPRVAIFFGGGKGTLMKERISSYLRQKLKTFRVVPDVRETHILVASEAPDECAATLLADDLLKRHVSGIRICDKICSSLEDIISFLPCPDPTRIYRLVASNANYKQLLHLLDDFHFHPTQFTHVLFVTPFQPDNEGPIQYLVATREASQLWKSQFNKEMEKHNHVSGAYFKLYEALQRFNVSVCGMRCIDIGASPGGWSECLIDEGASKVVAVEPGTLRFEHPNLVHVQSKFQDTSFDEKFDLVVCDMNYHRFQLVKDLSAGCVNVLKYGGDMIMTFKGRKRGWERKPTLCDIEREMLCPFFEEVRILHLISNTKFECTLYCRCRVKLE